MAAPARSGRLLRGCAIAGLTFLIIGVVAVICGLFLPGQISNKLHDGVIENILWTPQSPSSVDARYRNNSFPGAPDDLYRVWLFNISNLEDVRKGAKPVLVQVGPYVHRTYREKHEVMWTADGRVHFKDYNYYILDRNLTTADPTAPIATFNMALLGVLAKLHANTSPRLRPLADILMQIISSYQDPTMHGLFVVRPALELLWGYEDKLLKLISRVAPAALPPTGATVALMQNMTSLQEALSRNASVFNTGQMDISKIWNVESDHGYSVISSWPCPETVQGSDASQFRPGLTEADKLTVFVGDLFQTRDLVVNTTVQLHGIKLFRYWLDPAQDVPNTCRNMELKGVMNITGPHSAGAVGPVDAAGPEILVSMPMFCGADERLQEEVEGLHCDMDRHMTWVDVEPTTGITMRALKRLQISSRIGSLGSVLDPKVPGNLTIPMFWGEEWAEAPPDLAQQFRSTVYTAQWLEQNLGKLCWILGGCFVLFGVILAVVTVELASDPDKWAPTSQAAVVAAAQDMLCVGPSAAGEGSRGQGLGVAAGLALDTATYDSSTLAAEAGDFERQRLLAHSRTGDTLS